MTTKEIANTTRRVYIKKIEKTEVCFNGLLIHDFGGSIIREHIGKPNEFTCLEDLRRRLRLRIEVRNFTFDKPNNVVYI